jgi:hypothetical protein
MSCEPMLTHGVMEGDGAYNRHARLQAAGMALVMPVLEQAARNVTLDAGNDPVVIADYGSSQGKNSLAPIGAAIRGLRVRLGSDRPIIVIHVDQPRNDFNTLFEVLETDPDRYVLSDPRVFPCAVGRSFYGNVIPPEHVCLGWCSYAVVWLSRVPALVPGHFVALRSTGAVRAAYDRQGAADWETFLSLRASELRPGGRLLVVLPGLNDDGVSGFEALFDHANAALAELVDEGAIAADERRRMVLPVCPRRRCDLLAPFSRDGRFRGLTVEHCELSKLPDTAWTDYNGHGNGEVLATRHAQFFRSAFLPTLASALSSAGGAHARRGFGDWLEDRLKRRLASQPAPLNSFVQTIVLAKQDPTEAVTTSEQAHFEPIGEAAGHDVR